MRNKIKILSIVFISATCVYSCLDSNNKPQKKDTDTSISIPNQNDVVEVRGFLIDSIVSNMSTETSEEKRKVETLRSELIKVLPKFKMIVGAGDETDTLDYYIVEGDLKLDLQELTQYCIRLLKRTDTSLLKERLLTVRADGSGNKDTWAPGTIVKYSVRRNSFSSQKNYNDAVKYMQEATQDWMNVCNIKFQHLQNLDNRTIDPSTYPDTAFFIVRQINAYGSYIAQAFFPSDPTIERYLLLDNTFYTSPYAMVGVLRHELGHILGLLHEHIRSNDGTCPGESIIGGHLGIKYETPYDPYSVMHYPCGLNKNNTQLKLTTFDIEGIKNIYPY